MASKTLLIYTLTCTHECVKLFMYNRSRIECDFTVQKLDSRRKIVNIQQQCLEDPALQSSLVNRIIF